MFLRVLTAAILLSPLTTFAGTSDGPGGSTLFFRPDANLGIIMLDASREPDAPACGVLGSMLTPAKTNGEENIARYFVGWKSVARAADANYCLSGEELNRMCQNLRSTNLSSSQSSRVRVELAKFNADEKWTEISMLGECDGRFQATSGWSSLTRADAGSISTGTARTRRPVTADCVVFDPTVRSLAEPPKRFTAWTVRAGATMLLTLLGLDLRVEVRSIASNRFRLDVTGKSVGSRGPESDRGDQVEFSSHTSGMLPLLDLRYDCRVAPK